MTARGPVDLRRCPRVQQLAAASAVACTAVITGLVLTLVAAGVPAGAATVRVGVGQNLTEIAVANGTSIAALASANAIRDPNHVAAGTILTIPATGATGTGSVAATGSSSVVVAVGQNLTGIARRYGTTVAALVQANGIINANRVIAGSRLVIPGSATTGATALAASTALASYSAPVTPAVGSLPPQLLALPDRLALRPGFARWAAQLGVPAGLLEAMCWWESGWQSGVVSATGAQGIGQLEPSTVTAMRAQLHQPALNPMVASDNIEMAAGLLHDLLAETGGNTGLALAGYYQGLSSVLRSGSFPSTVQYVRGILAYTPSFS